MPDACIGAFKNGVRPGSLNNKLGRKSASSTTEIRARVHMYILEEKDDALKRQRDEIGETEVVSPQPPLKERGGDDRVEKAKHQEKKAPHAAKQSRRTPYQPRGSYEYRCPWQQQHQVMRWEEASLVLNTNLADIYREIKDTNMVGDPEMQKRSPRNVDMYRWCEDHRTVGHDTNEWYTLKREIKKLIKVRHLGRFVQRNDHQQPSTRQENQETLATTTIEAASTFTQGLGPPFGMINMIAGSVRAVRQTLQERSTFEPWIQFKSYLGGLIIRILQQ